MYIVSIWHLIADPAALFFASGAMTFQFYENRKLRKILKDSQADFVIFHRRYQKCNEQRLPALENVAVLKDELLEIESRKYAPRKKKAVQHVP